MLEPRRARIARRATEERAKRGRDERNASSPPIEATTRAGPAPRRPTERSAPEATSPVRSPPAIWVTATRGNPAPQHGSAHRARRHPRNCRRLPSTLGRLQYGADPGRAGAREVAAALDPSHAAPWPIPTPARGVSGGATSEGSGAATARPSTPRRFAPLRSGRAEGMSYSEGPAPSLRRTPAPPPGTGTGTGSGSGSGSVAQSTTAIASISTRAPRGSAATCTVERAGGWCVNARA